MIWYKWIAIISLVICAGSCLLHMIRLIRNGKPQDYSNKRGDTGKSVRYAFTGAMNPVKKESAFLHLPTYTAGLLYHMGTFLSIFLFILLLAGFNPPATLNLILAVFFILTAGSGYGILVKRVVKSQLRYLSNVDDYISNFIVSSIQLLSALILLRPEIQVFYYLGFSLFFLYLPIGKLRHTIYFFAARYQLGMFYGWRGVWPPKNG